MNETSLEKPAPGSSDGNLYSDQKRSSEVGELHTRSVAIKPQHRLLHDPNVTFEEYLFYAERTRAEEDGKMPGTKPRVTLKAIFVPSANSGVVEGAAASGAWDAVTELNLSDPGVRAGISDEEWANASRALRTATAAACFYLITTDILGPFVSRSHPPLSPFFVDSGIVSTLKQGHACWEHLLIVRRLGSRICSGYNGVGRGIRPLHSLWGVCRHVSAICRRLCVQRRNRLLVMKCSSGWLLWKVFMHVDSYQFPAKNYGDLAYRVYGKWFRWLVNFTQALQLLLSVGNIIISNGYAHSNLLDFSLSLAGRAHG